IRLQLRGASNCHSASTGRYEGYVLQVLIAQEVADVLSQRLNGDPRPRQMDTVATASQARRVDQVPSCPQRRRHLAPTPPPEVHPMDQDNRLLHAALDTTPAPACA